MNLVVTTPRIRESLESVSEQLRRCGTWWDAPQVGAIVRRARDGFAQRRVAPWLRQLPDEVEALPAAAVAVIDRVTADPGSIDRRWAREQIAVLGLLNCKRCSLLWLWCAQQEAIAHAVRQFAISLQDGEVGLSHHLPSALVARCRADQQQHITLFPVGLWHSGSLDG